MADRPLQLCGQPFVTFALGKRFVVGHVHESRIVRQLREMQKSGGDVVSVRLVLIALAAIFESRFACEELAKQGGAAGAVNARETRHDAAALPNELFGLAQDLSRLVLRLGSAIFIDPFAVRLRVDGGATRKDEAIGLQDLDEILRPLKIDSPVAFRSPAAGAGAVDDRIECSGPRSCTASRSVMSTARTGYGFADNCDAESSEWVQPSTSHPAA